LLAAGACSYSATLPNGKISCKTAGDCPEEMICHLDQGLDQGLCCLQSGCPPDGGSDSQGIGGPVADADSTPDQGTGFDLPPDQSLLPDQSLPLDRTLDMATAPPDSAPAGECKPQGLRCSPGNIGQACSSMGRWISNGSSVSCICWLPGRFLQVAPDLVKDTVTNLTWDLAPRPTSTWATASQACEGAGMRLPTRAEWAKVVIWGNGIEGQINGKAPGAQCPGFGNPPLDLSAMPTLPNDFPMWTGETEPGFMGFVFVVKLAQNTMVPTYTLYSTDQKATDAYHFRCVK
jgi:hypothetical protein